MGGGKGEGRRDVRPNGRKGDGEGARWGFSALLIFSTVSLYVDGRQPGDDGAAYELNPKSWTG